MRIATRMICLLLLPAGCTGYQVSGTLTLPAGLTIADDVSCSDITVTVYGQGDMSGGTVGSTSAVGDIATGSCHYALAFTPESSALFYTVQAYVRDIRYAECGDQAVRTGFESAGLGWFYSLFGQTIDLPATASCP